MEKDVKESVDLFTEISKCSLDCLLQIKTLKDKLKLGSSSSNEGISLLDLKNQLMSDYMTNMCSLMDKKTSGESVSEHPSIYRLIEIRTVLEKMRPIEHKLKYQINKVVAAFKEGKTDASDPRKFRANLAAFSNVENESSSEEEEDSSISAKTNENKLYVAPKVTPMHYSDDETKEERLKKSTEKKKRKVLSSAMLKEMREAYTEAPIEISEGRDIHRFKDNKREKERTEYEERNFMRLSVSKKETASNRRLGTVSSLGLLADFGGGSFEENGPAKKKQKGSFKNQKGKKHMGKKGLKKKRR